MFNQFQVTEQINECMKESDLTKRISLFKTLANKVPRASKPYIDFLVRKYSKKLLDQSWTL